MGLLNKKIMLSLTGLFLIVTAMSFRNVYPMNSQQVVSVWSEISIQEGGAYSWSAYSSNLAELPSVRDCLRPFPIDCFSIQQNFWISDYSGTQVLWARNLVYLAKLGGIYHGTYSFQVYSRDDRNLPILCVPQSNSTSTCRSPFYVDYSPFPQTFKFYSHISSSEVRTALEMVNNFGAVTWDMPSTVVCPCFIETVSRSSQPWGSWPFELVAVGIDSTATATFRNDTRGTIGSTIVQFTDGSWHQTSLGVEGCVELQDCLRLLSTQEISRDLAWDMERNQFYWSRGALDQGVHITEVMEGNTSPPVLQSPRSETYLYFEFSSQLAYLSVYDSSRRLVGINPQTGRPEAEIPNSSLVLSSYVPVKDTPFNVPEEELLIVNPQGEYQAVITAGGNTPYSIFLSKVTNANEVVAKDSFVGSLIIGDSKTLQVDSRNLMITRSPEPEPSPGILSMVGLVVTLISVMIVILALLARRRKKILRLRPDYDEFRVMFSQQMEFLSRQASLPSFVSHSR